MYHAVKMSTVGCEPFFFSRAEIFLSCEILGSTLIFEYIKARVFLVEDV